MPKSISSSSPAEQPRPSTASVFGSRAEAPRASTGSMPALSPLASEVLELYASALSDVRFPDLDLTTLHTLADELRDAQQEVDRLDAEAHDARERVASCSAKLDARAERALAYARIFAEGKPDLEAAVDAVRPPTQRQDTSPPKRRGRPRKPEANDAQLDVLDHAAE